MLKATPTYIQTRQVSGSKVSELLEEEFKNLPSPAIASSKYINKNSKASRNTGANLKVSEARDQV